MARIKDKKREGECDNQCDKLDIQENLTLKVLSGSSSTLWNCLHVLGIFGNSLGIHFFYGFLKIFKICFHCIQML